MLAAPNRPGRSLWLWLLPAILVPFLLLPTPADATVENRVHLTLLPNAGKRLGAKNVRMISTGLARGRGNQVRLPVLAGRIGAANARLRLGGGFRLRVRAPRRKVRTMHLGRFELRLGKRSLLMARPPRSRTVRPIFIIRHGPRALALNAGAKKAKLRGARLIPTPQARTIFRRHLGLKNVRALPLGRLTLTADLTAFDLPPVPPPPLVPLPPPPEKLARPATAVAVSSADVVWCVRASWVRYIGNGTVANGASHETPFVVNNNKADFDRVCDLEKKNVIPTSGRTAYRYYFTFKEGWYDAATNRAALYFTGKVNFKYPLRGIDLDFNDLEVEINGSETRSIFTVEGRDGSIITPTRVVFAQNILRSPPLTPGSGGTLTSREMRSYLPEATALGVFAGNYMPPDNNDFGWISVDFTPAG